ncbi:hypothetical protein I3J09_27825 [Streptomyces clavuligerus]|uniref:Uncharacterized protein n=1 Tax=Streptomyces clavuligerus TaxID=1901 RepID=E2Q5W9_STRCL|nr:hypothetical protein [Streptomyces clavuligerus]ANW21684.1 hypothetical protein BB341_27460 [Streptomyces clavuligerus]AXU16313.1 hypothetical protein D1794_28530 [Streptomyces clavuligerus]EFG05129.1 Hypothetical protein SCLAV_0053 [Streptomyces clavuligerus]MBY6306474.1 hypothetical protein [Streptomyces clavuligerus]QCS09093.1 hypothetical protein CRV15_27890 [Streptomyces clavuligerus]
MTVPASGAAPLEIEVRRCTVTVVRSGGWSWGPDPRGLVDRVVDALPGLLAEHFAGVLPGDGPDLELTGPVAVTVSASGTGPAHGGTAPLTAAFDTPPPLPDDSGPGAGAAAPGLSFEESLRAADRSWSPLSPSAFFAELAERDELGALLALLPDDSLRGWLRALLAEGAPPPGPGGNGAGGGAAPDPGPAGRLLAELARRSRTPASAGPPGGGEPDSGGDGPEAEPDGSRAATAAAGGPDPDAGARAVAAVLARDGAAAAARLLADTAGRPDAGDPSRLCSALAAVADPGGLLLLAEALGGAVPPGEPPRDTAPETGGPAPSARPGGAPALGAPRTAGEVPIWSALPFLLAGPLARIGYLDAVGPALAAAEAAGDAPCFAVALAYKVLGTTARGWRREQRDTEAAAVFAGLPGPLPEEYLAGFARRARPALPALDGVLALAVGRGHDPAEPLLLTGVDGDGGVLLLDAQGLFPVAWSADAAGLLPHWRGCGSPPVLVCGVPPPPGVLGALAAGGARLLTGIRPLRGEPLVRLAGRRPLWASAGQPPDPRLARALPGHAERVTELVRALVTERRAVPLDPGGALERSVTLAAALGLSTLAWTLWRDRETPDPVTALRRLADLDAVVRFGPDTVRVRIPLGRRHTDLLRGGLLADVRDVVWLDGRTLTFTGG